MCRLLLLVALPLLLTACVAEDGPASGNPPPATNISSSAVVAEASSSVNTPSISQSSKGTGAVVSSSSSQPDNLSSVSSSSAASQPISVPSVSSSSTVSRPTSVPSVSSSSAASQPSNNTSSYSSQHPVSSASSSDDRGAPHHHEDEQEQEHEDEHEQEHEQEQEHEPEQDGIEPEAADEVVREVPEGVGDACTVEVAGSAVPLPAMSETHTHHNHAGMHFEHMAAMELTAYEQTTHAAIKDGLWCDPSVWHTHTVPGTGARVVIPEGRQVTYNHISDSRLHTVRVDGELIFAANTSSRIILDTLVQDPRGSLTIGTVQSPVSPSAKVEILIADNGDIDVDWDPMLLSRGLILHGKTRIHGATKTAHIKVATDPRAGDSILHLQSAPQNWRVGDTLVIAGSRFSGWKWDNSIGAVRYHGTQDEVRTIAAVNGSQLTLDSPLSYDHITPRADLKVSVGNYSRNVVIANENAVALPVHRRGHVMFMHNRDADVRFAEFFELGRTDKSRTNMEVTSLSTVRANSNIRGRYSFHFHRAGISDPRNPAIAIGNAVFGSPGWGYVHHDSHAMFHQNVSFDTFGAGFVAETGNETGAWTDNLAIKAEGISGSFNPKNNNDINGYDIARSGDGFWFQGRLVASIGNIAASVNRGFTYFHRDKSGTMIRVPPSAFMLPEALGLGRDSGADDIPIRHFHHNEAFASTVGLFVVKANPDQEHDVYTVMSDFIAWEVTAGASVEYTAHYLLRNFDLTGNTPEPFRRPQVGIQFGTNTTDMVVRGGRIENFAKGIELAKDHTSGRPLGKDQFVVIGTEMESVDTPYDQQNSSDLIINESQLVNGRLALELGPVNSDGFMEYLDASTGAGSGISIEGSKTDSIGTIALPAGYDKLELGSFDMIALLTQKGYYRTADGDAYAVIEAYFSDRATGDLYMRGIKTYIGPDVDRFLESPYSRWGTADYQGLIDLDNQPPAANNNTASTTVNTEVTVSVLNNDTDPEGDALRVNAVVAPVHGQVFHNGRSITYRPYFGFKGKDSFHYWITDGQGNFDRALVEVDVY